MTTRPKDRGTAAETAVRRWMCAHGFPWAERLALAGASDCGDISLVPGRAVIVEVKSHAGGAAAGQIEPAVLKHWMNQTELERCNAGADVAALVVKRRGTTDVAAWWAYVPMWTLVELLEAKNGIDDTDAPICMSVASLTALLRSAGYGQP